MLWSNKQSSFNRSLPRPNYYFKFAISCYENIVNHSLPSFFLKSILFSSKELDTLSLFTKLLIFFAFTKHCIQQESIEKPTVDLFRLTTRNLKLLFYFLLC